MSQSLSLAQAKVSVMIYHSGFALGLLIATLWIYDAPLECKQDVQFAQRVAGDGPASVPTSH